MWRFFLINLLFSHVSSIYLSTWNAPYRKAKLKQREDFQRQPNNPENRRCVHIFECSMPELNLPNIRETEIELDRNTGLPDGYNVVGVPQRYEWRHIYVMKGLASGSVIAFNNNTKISYEIGYHLNDVNGMSLCSCSNYYQQIWFQTINLFETCSEEATIAAIDKGTGDVFYVVSPELVKLPEQKLPERMLPEKTTPQMTETTEFTTSMTEVTPATEVVSQGGGHELKVLTALAIVTAGIALGLLAFFYGGGILAGILGAIRSLSSLWRLMRFRKYLPPSFPSEVSENIDTDLEDIKEEEEKDEYHDNEDEEDEERKKKTTTKRRRKTTTTEESTTEESTTEESTTPETTTEETTTTQGTTKSKTCTTDNYENDE